MPRKPHFHHPGSILHLCHPNAHQGHHTFFTGTSLATLSTCAARSSARARMLTSMTSVSVSESGSRSSVLECGEKRKLAYKRRRPVVGLDAGVPAAMASRRHATIPLQFMRLTTTSIHYDVCNMLEHEFSSPRRSYCARGKGLTPYCV